MQGGTRYYSISNYFIERFGCKTVKLSLDAGFTCPNRDGTRGTGGCAFCSAAGSGDFASSIPEQIQLLKSKWPAVDNYIAYFQSHTNTYAPVDHLRTLYYEALNDPAIAGLAIATRPDCLGNDVLDLLEEINRDHFLWVELGIQSIHPLTQKAMNLCYTTQDFNEAVQALRSRGIRTVAHLILGLPGESEEMMFSSHAHVVAQGVWGLKFHFLNVIKGTRLYEEMPDYVPFDSIEQYTDLVVRLLEHTPPDITIHRLTADAPRSLLVAPDWSSRKRTILNTINRELALRDTKQGAAIE
ncbi:MAG: TIGR01212 family radical SAM protein [Mogibacterium sp.]|nr:TIGR01212 family radical SAM protein [Mogibacterium sp.]